MERLVSRRQLLIATGAATALSLAGCGYRGSNDPEGDPNDAHDLDDTHGVMVVVDIDRGELRAAQEEVQETKQEVRQKTVDGEIDEAEAQRTVTEARNELKTTQKELLSESISAVEDHVEETDSLSVIETEPEFGAMLVEGDGDALVEILALESVQAILDGAKFDDVREQT